MRTGLVSLGILAAAMTQGGLATAGSPLTADKMIVALRPESPSDRDFIIYSAAVMEAGFLTPYLVESTFLWAREKPEHMARYYRQALIVRAGKQGIDLPKGDPPLSGAVQGQVVFEVHLGLLKIRTPVANAFVRLGDRTTPSDANGNFTFEDVPFGRYTVRAEGKVALIDRQGSAKVALPTAPPSTEPVAVTVFVR